MLERVAVALPDDDREARRRARVEVRRARETSLRSSWGRVLIAAVAALAVVTVAGLVALWPGEKQERKPSSALGGPTTGAEVVAERLTRCPGPAGQRCRQIEVRLDSGRIREITLGPAEVVPAVGVGAKVRVHKVDAPAGATGVEPYAYAGRDRRGVLLWVTLAFAAMVVALTRWRGLLALVGFALSLLLVTKFMVPAILAGSSGLLVALVGSLAVMFVTVLLTYGLTPPSLAACLGIAASLLLAALAGVAVVGAAHLDGSDSELATYLAIERSSLSLQGVVLAGLVIGALGVLADMGVTQASAVMAIRHANPELSVRQLFSGGFRVGRDHLVATTHTLVLVYVGATLPLLLTLHASGVALIDAVNTQDISEPILATLIGAMALLVSVPITTALTAAVVHGIPPAALASTAHARPH